MSRPGYDEDVCALIEACRDAYPGCMRAMEGGTSEPQAFAA